MSWESFGVVGFDLGPLLQGQTRIAKLETNSYKILGWESSDVRFDLWPLLQGQMMVHWLW